MHQLFRTDFRTGYPAHELVHRTGLGRSSSFRGGFWGFRGVRTYRKPRKPGNRSRVLLCFIDPRVRKIRNEASSCPGIFSRTLRLYYVASSPGSPLSHLLDGHRKLVGFQQCHAQGQFGTLPDQTFLLFCSPSDKLPMAVQLLRRSKKCGYSRYPRRLGKWLPLVRCTSAGGTNAHFRPNPRNRHIRRSGLCGLGLVSAITDGSANTQNSKNTRPCD